MLGADDFYLAANQTVFRILSEHIDNGEAVDIPRLQFILQERNLLEQVGGVPYLFELVAGAVEHSGRQRDLFRKLRACRERREAHRIFETSAKSVEGYQSNAPAIIEAAHASLGKLLNGDLYAEVSERWGSPIPLEGQLPPVLPCDPAMLPEVYRALVEDAAHRMQVPLDYPAAAGIVTLAGAVNRRCLMYPKQHDTSFVLAGNLWGITVGPPGRKKSPAADVMIAPLKRIDIGLRDNYERALENHKLEDERAQIRLTAWKEQIKRLDRDQYKDKPGGRVPSDEQPRPKMPEGPTCQKLITNDITVEKLQIRLAENPAGI